MIKPNIRQIAEKNGITTAYQLQKLLNIQPSLAAKWYRNDLKMIGFDSLNTLCKAFNCLPSDLIVYAVDDDAQAVFANNAKLGNAESNNTKTSNTQTSKALELPVLDAKTDYWMATKHIAEVVGRETRTVRDFYKQGLPFTKTSKGNFVKFSDYSIFMQNRKKNQK